MTQSARFSVHSSGRSKHGSKLLTAIFAIVIVVGGGGAYLFWSDTPKLIKHITERDNLAPAAAWVLRQQGPPEEAREPLKAALELGDPKLRAAAARALGAYRKRDLVAELGKSVTTDSDPGVRAAAAEGLGMISESNCAPWIRAALDDSSPDVQAAACGAVADLVLLDCVPKLIDFLESRHIPLRQGAKKALDRFLPAGEESREFSRESWTLWYENRQNRR
jgi:HEAT repeat protein